MLGRLLNTLSKAANCLAIYSLYLPYLGVRGGGVGNGDRREGRGKERENAAFLSEETEVLEPRYKERVH